MVCIKSKTTSQVQNSKCHLALVDNWECYLCNKWSVAVTNLFPLNSGTDAGLPGRNSTHPALNVN